MNPFKLIGILLVLQFASMISFAQKALRNEWFIGSAKSKISFNDTFANTFLLNVNDSIFGYFCCSNSNLCDSSGKFLIGSNSQYVFNSIGAIYSNGDKPNTDSFNWYNGSSAYSNNSIFIPKGKSSSYLFISTQSDSKVTDFVNNGGVFDFDEIIYSIIDLKANNGAGEIISNRNLLLKTTQEPWLNNTNFTATKHANGRDYWLIKPSARQRNIRYKFLVQPDTILSFVDTEPIRWSSFTGDNVGQAVFSPNGEWYAECNSSSPHTIYNFDRCSGLFTLNRLIDMSKYTVSKGWSRWDGVCFSPNNRFLYTSDAYNIYQIDLQEPNDSLAIKVVSIVDTVNFPMYNTMQLTPTGQLLMGNWGITINTLNGVMQPDNIGVECKFKLDYIVSHLKFKNVFSPIGDPPNMPFYELGAVAGSPCDTIKQSISPFQNWQIYPNPSQGKITIQVPNTMDNFQLAMYNVLGQKVLQKTIAVDIKYRANLDFSNMPNGMYLLLIETGGKPFIQKLLKY